MQTRYLHLVKGYFPFRRGQRYFNQLRVDMAGMTSHSADMARSEDRAHHWLIVLVFSAIIGLIVCAAYMTQPDWGFPESAGHGTSFAAPAMAGER